MSGRDHSETWCDCRDLRTCGKFCDCECHRDNPRPAMPDQLAQLRADLARVTAERDDLRARCKFQDQRIERAIRCSDRLVDERDALRALLPTEVEREALRKAHSILFANKNDRYVRESRNQIDAALAYLDRLLGGGR